MEERYKKAGNIIRVSSLSHVLHIGKKPGRDEDYESGGYFDDQKNYYPDPRYPDFFMLEPWEWTSIPEIVALAKQQGVEVPEDPPFDISKTF